MGNIFEELTEGIFGLIENTVDAVGEIADATVELGEGLAKDTADKVDAVLGTGKYDGVDFEDRIYDEWLPSIIKENVIADNLIYDSVIPEIGSIVKCDLIGGIADHTGIYIGCGEIIELNGNGYIKKISINRFLNGGSLRTGDVIHVACDANNYPISDSNIAKYAQSKIGSRRHYSVDEDNCHRFVSECINEYSSQTTLLCELESELAKEYNNNRPMRWRAWDRN